MSNMGSMTKGIVRFKRLLSASTEPRKCPGNKNYTQGNRSRNKPAWLLERIQALLTILVNQMLLNQHSQSK
jgi:hypothetical protein